jgi:histidyl-tRNA synthetase
MSGKKPLVEPRTLKGFLDILPEEALTRRAVVTVIESVFHKYGFVPLETPALEHLDTLLGTGGEEVNKELLQLESPEGEPVALRFDQTVPFARLMAQYPDKLKAPFRRCAIGPVWRADKPGQWRLRQFTQVDVDIAGAVSLGADAEVVAVVCEIMEALGAGDYAVLINNRKLIDALLEGCGITKESRGKHVLRVIDKLAKVGEHNVRLELAEGRVDDSGDPIPGVHLDADTIDKILSFIAVTGHTRQDIVAKVEAALPDSENTQAAIAEMRELDECLTVLGVSEEHAPFAPSLARGLDYYTGPVFEITIPGAGEIGSVGGGGRYDGLVERFMNRPIRCTGMAFGLERLIGALSHLGVAPQPETAVDALVVIMGKVPAREPLQVATELREAGIRTEVYFGKTKNMKRQLSHADHYGIPVAVILGEDEVANGVVSIKDLHAGKQQREHIDDHEEYRKAGKTAQVTVPRADMAKTIQEMLG